MARGPLRIRITLDEGLADHMRGYASIGIHGDLRETIVYCIREHIIGLMHHEAWRTIIEPHLNRPYGRKHRAGEV